MTWVKETVMTYLRPEPDPAVAHPLQPNLRVLVVLQDRFEGED